MPGGCPPPIDRVKENGVADTEQPDGIADPALVRAMGGALAVFATLMARKGIAPLDEIANLIGIYAVVTGETAPDEGLILGCWGGMLRDAAQALDQDAAE